MDRHTAGLFVYFLKREFRSRYSGNWAGILWVFLHPVLLLGVYTLIFKYILRLRFDEVSESQYVYFWGIAMWPWLTLQESLLKATQVLPSNLGLIKKATFPREVLVFSSVFAAILLQGIGYIIFLLFGLVAGEVTFLGIPWIVLIFLIQIVFVLGIALVLATIQPFLKDLEQLLPVLLMVWMYLTPILYPYSLVPSEWRFLLDFNPLTVLIECYRDAAFSGTINNGGRLFVFALLTIGLFVLAKKFFRVMENYFEDFL